MLSEKEKQQLIILRQLHKSDIPLGSGMLKDAIRSEGMELSEATVGRLLRDLDLQGFTLRIGFQGRTLTTVGSEYLEQLERDYQRSFYGSELIKSLNTRRKQDLIDILIARRAVEGEIARLAAKNASDNEVDKMRSIVQKQAELINAGESGVQQDSEFHTLLAKAGQNHVLYTVLDLIRREGSFSPVIERIRNQMRGSMVKDHLEILVAIQSRDPEQAYQAMVNHIEGLIQDVEH